MKKILIVLFAAILSSCATLQPFIQSFNNPVSRERLVQIEAAYGIALSAAVAYRRLPLCKKSQPFSAVNVCAKRSVIVQLQDADRRVQSTLSVARKFVIENPTLDAFILLNVAQDAINYFQSIQTSNGIIR